MPIRSLGLAGLTGFLVLLSPLRAQTATYAFSVWAGMPVGGNGSNVDGAALAARFAFPHYVAADQAGTIYVTEVNGGNVRKISSAGVVTTFGSLNSSLYGVAVDSTGNIFVADLHSSVIRKVTPAGVASVFAGTVNASGHTDGAGAAARFTQPAGVAVDAAGNLYVSDVGTHTIRRISPAAEVTTLAGFGAGSSDGTGFGAHFNTPYGIAVDHASGFIYVADTLNETLRKVTPAGAVTTLAGKANVSGSTDGTGSTARFNFPTSVCVDSSGRIFVTDTNNNTIRMVTPAGVVTTVGGQAGTAGTAEGAGSEARFSSPYGIAIDNAGVLYIADATTNTIRKGSPASAPVFTAQPAATAAPVAGVASFTVGVMAAPTAALRWQRQAGGSGAFVDLENDFVYNGVRATTLTITGVTATMNGDRFRCVASNGQGAAATSNATSLSTNTGPFFTSAPRATFIAGQANSFTFSAAGAPAPVFNLTSGTLPLWLQLTNGVLSGTPPTAPASHSFVLQATNGVSSPVTQSFTLTVQAVTAPPAITSLPSPRQVVPLGQSITLDVAAASGSAMSYQWVRSGFALEGATRPSLTISNTAMHDAGWYQVAVTNANGTTTSPVVFVNVSVLKPQLIAWGANDWEQLAIPANLGPLTAIAAGGRFSLALKSDGTIAAWGYGGQGQTGALSGLTDVVAISAGESHAAALRSDGTLVGWGGDYQGELSWPISTGGLVSVACGTQYTIALKPDSQVLGWGANSFGQRSGVPASNNVVAISAGFTHAYGLRRERVVIGWGSNFSGEASEPQFPPLVNMQAVSAGNGFTVAIRANGSIATWGSGAAGGLPVPSDATNIVALATNSHTLALKADGTVLAWGSTGSGKTAVPAGLHHVVAIAAGSSHSLVLRDAAADPVAPIITAQPANASANALAGTTTFQVVATGDPAPAFKWQRQAAGTAGFVDLSDGSLYSGVATATLTVTNPPVASHGDQFRCVAINAGGTATSNAGTLTVLVAPTFTSASAVSFAPGVAGSFTLTATSSPVATFSVAGGAFPSWATLNQTTGVISGTPPNAAGSPFVLMLQATNGVQTALQNFILTVQSPPAFTNRTSAVFIVGQSNTFAFSASGVPAPIFQLQGSAPAGVTFDGTTGVLSGTPTSTVNSPFLFTVFAINGVDPNAMQSFTLQVQDPMPPAITVPPSSRTVVVGASVTLRVEVTGTPPLSYQWIKDDAPMPGATGSSLVFDVAQPAFAGAYKVAVSNSAGTITSAVATLGVLSPGTVATHATTAGGYVAGGTLTVTNTLNYVGPVTGLGWRVLLPDGAGWSYAASTATGASTVPPVGPGDLLDWVWTTAPASPVTFTYTLNVPAGATGGQLLTAVARLLQGGGVAEVLAAPDPLRVMNAAERHSADTTPADGAIDLFELTRVIELYNTRNGTVRTGAYRVDPTGEDGFAADATRPAGSSVALARHHSADTTGATAKSPRDGAIDLFELTRVIELYNTRAGTVRTGAYHVQAGTEDGFTAGP